MKRLLAFTLVFCMMLSVVPAFAEEPAVPLPEAQPAAEEIPAPETQTEETAVNTAEVPAENSAVPAGEEITGGSFRYKLDADGNAIITGHPVKEEHVVVPATIDGHPVTVIARGALSLAGNYGYNMITVSLPDSIRTIESSAFYDNNQMVSIKMPAGLETLGESAFRNCRRLESIEIGDNVTEIAKWAFDGCNKLASVKLPAKLQKLGSQAFRSCGLTEVTIPKGITAADQPFAGCPNLKTARFEEGTLTVPSRIFEFCDGLESVYLPDSVTKIGKSAFSNCPNLKNLNKIPANLEEVGIWALGGFQNLTEVTLPKTLKPYSCKGAFVGNTGLAKVTFEDGMTYIPDGILTGSCAENVSITIPQSVKVIGDEAFLNCKVKAVTLPDSVKNIGKFAFKASGLTDIRLPAQLETLGDSAFDTCTALKTAWIPKTLKTIGPIPREVMTFDDPGMMLHGPFAGCTALESVTVEEGMQVIPEKLFADIPAQSPMKTVVLPESTTQVANVFWNCDSIESFVFPKNVKLVAVPFDGCDSLKSIAFTENPNAYTEIYGLARNCPALESITLADGVGHVENLAENCEKLTEIRLPKTCRSIMGGLCRGCAAVKDLYIPDSVTTIFGALADKPAEVTIHGIPGSQAQTYANANGYKFVDGTVHASSIQFKKDKVTATTVAQLPLEYTITPADASDPVTWEVSNSEVVEVNSSTGLLQTKYETGTATVTVRCGDVSDTITVEVLDNDMTLPEISIVGEPRQLKAYGLRASENGWQHVEDPDVRWELMEGDATLTPDGMLTANKAGRIEVRAIMPNVFDYGTVSRLTLAVKEITNVTDVSQLESAHPYTDDEVCRAWKYTISGAKNLSITFDERTDLGSNYDDYLIIESNGGYNRYYYGTDLSGRTLTVEGDTVQLTMHNAKEGADSWGFKVTKLEEAKAVWQRNPDRSWMYVNPETGPVKGVRYIGSEFYVFDENGILQTGDEDGDLAAYGNLYYINPERDLNRPETCYFMRNYKRVRPGVGVTYYDIYGITYVGWVESKDDAGNPVKYYQTKVQDAEGNDLYIYVWRNQYIPEWINPVTKEVTPAGLYLFGDDGILKTSEGWYRNETWPEGDNMYYVQENGTAATGVRYIDGEFYIFGDDGRLLTGDENGDQMYNGNLYYYPEGQRCFVRNYSRVRPGVGITYYNNEGITYVGWVSSTDAEGNPIRLYQTKVNVDGKDLYIYVWRAQQIPEWTNPVTGEVTPAGFYLFGDDGILITEDGIYECGDGNTYVVEGGVITETK